MIKNRFDKKAQQEGKWFKYDSADILLTSVKNEKFIQAYAKATSGEKEDEELILEALSNLVADWKGVFDEDGTTPLEFSLEELDYFLKEDDDFRNWVLQTALNQENYKRELVEKKAKK